MPYKTVEQAEESSPGLSKYSAKAKRGWLSAFNSAMESGKDESAAFAIAYSVANKVDGRTSSDLITAASLVIIASELEASDPKIAMSLLQEAKALKLKARVLEFFDEAKRFKGEMNKVISDLTSSVQNPRALAAFPPLKDILELGRFMSVGVLKEAHTPESDIEDMMLQVVSLDAR